MKDKITLSDNQQPASKYCFVDNNEKDISNGKIPYKARALIEAVSSAKRLKEEHKIIAIPSEGGKSDTVIEIRNSKLYTFNLIGVISTPIADQNNDVYRIEIRSRFDEGNKQYFLLYLLNCVYGFNIFNIDVNSKEESNYIIILIILYLNKLIEAYSDGLYKEYIRQKYNDYNFKGAIDINIHLKLNTPFMGKTAYTIREYTYDNEILCLMRQVIDYIAENHSKIWNESLNSKSILSEIVEVIENATPSYRMNINYVEALKCRREITHPMYQNYEEARKLAIMILDEAGQNIFDADEDLSLGLLIDIAWLWEEFVAERLLKKFNYKHLLTGRKGESLQWAEKEYWYPDFIEKGEGEDKGINIFDAKYKRWKWDNNDRDIHQLISYLFISGGDKCGVIYPSDEDEELEQKEEPEQKELYPFKSFYKEERPIFYRLPLHILSSKTNVDYSEYCKDMDKKICKWKQHFSEVIKKVVR